MENKLVFYKSCLKLEVILIEQGKKRKKKSIFDPTIILTKINEIEKEISRNKDKKYLEANEEELSFQAKNLENQAYKKAINTLNDVIIDYSNGNIRTTLMNFCSSLKAKMPFDEMILVILNKEKDNIIPDIKINAEDDNIYTYDYKNDRLYERVVSFNNLMGTPVEKLLSNKNELIINLQSEENMVKSPINGSDLRKEYKYLFASSLNKGNKTYGNIFFLSKTFDILGNYPKFILSLVTKELSFAMVSLFNINNNNHQYNILKTCNKNTNSGIIYYDVNNESYYFSDEVFRIISDITPTSTLNNEIRYTDYMKYIVKSDYDKLIIRNEKISLKQPYEIEYHLKEIDDNKNVILVHEQASPYITLSDEVYYCGKITKVVLSEQIIDDFKTKNILDEKEFDSFIYNNSHKNMIINAFKFNNELNDNEVFNLIRNNYTKYNNSDSNFNSKIYFIKGIYYYVLFDLSEKKHIKLIKEMAKYCSCSYFVYPNIIKILDDINNISMFVLKEKNGFESFTNDLYASYISLDALNECFNKSLINKDISLDLRKVTVGNYFFGYYLTPCLKGIYDYDSLINIDD